MNINLENQKLPQIYKRQGKECYLDPIRQKLIYITPEETVRQKVISYLINELSIPANMLTVEEHISHYNEGIKKRADIIVRRYNKADDLFYPIAVVECKAPNVFIGEKQQFQAFEYADYLDCDYVMVVNNDIAMCYKYNKDINEYELIDGLPNYSDMLCGKSSKIPKFESAKRFTLDEIKKEYSYYIGMEIGGNTPRDKQYAMVNFIEGLFLDDDIKLECNNYGLFNLIEDYGVRLLSYGNHSGGNFSGPYRSFLIDYKGSTEFVSIGVSSINRNDKTYINVAIDDEKKSHHSLQLNVDDNVVQNGDVFKFFHSGRIAVGNIGSGKVSELKEYINNMNPEILVNDKIYLGSLKYNRLWSLEDEEFKNLIVNLISYALVRDEYRKCKLDKSED